MVQRFVDLAGGTKAKIVVFAMASVPVLGESGLVLSVLPSGSSYYPATGKVVLPQ